MKASLSEDGPRLKGWNPWDRDEGGSGYLELNLELLARACVCLPARGC